MRLIIVNSNLIFLLQPFELRVSYLELPHFIKRVHHPLWGLSFLVTYYSVQQYLREAFVESILTEVTILLQKHEQCIDIDVPLIEFIREGALIGIYQFFAFNAR
jgi:hypothetical protein